MTSVQVSANPRLVKEADALMEAGYSVHVIAPSGASALHPFDETILRAARWTYTVVPTPALPVHAWRTLKQRVARRCLGRFPSHTPELSVISHDRMTPTLQSAAEGVRADLYLAHHLGALPAAKAAARKHRAKVGFDAEDLHSAELNVSQADGGDQVARRAIEASFLPACDMLTAASPMIAERYSALYGIRMLTILNVFPRSYAPPRPAPRGGDSGTLSLYWFSQTIGPGRGLESVIQAMAMMQHPARMVLRGDLLPEYAAHVDALCRQLGLRDAISFQPFADLRQLTEEAPVHDVGLALERNAPLNRAVCLTNKIFVYLLAGLPILLSRTPAQARLACDLGAAARLVDGEHPLEIAHALDLFAADPGARQAARDTAWRLGQDRFNWDIEKLKWLALIERQIGSARRPRVLTGS